MTNDSLATALERATARAIMSRQRRSGDEMTSPRRARSIMFGSALFLAAGCGDDDDESSVASFPAASLDPDDVDRIESLTGSSAPQVFNLGYTGVALATFENGEVCSTVDGVEMCMPIGNGCPAMTETDDGFVIEGEGCTTDDGAVWTGRVVARGLTRADGTGAPEPADSATIDYEELTIESPSDCPDATAPSRITLDGRLEMTSSGASGFDFDLRLEVSGSGVGDDCTDIGDVAGAYEYQGSRREDGTQQIWNGSGRIGSSASGAYEAETVDEVLDSSVCSSEALSGTTTVKAGEDVAVFTYDGATDCDEASTVTWTFNGADRGELEGVRCAVGRARFGPLGIALGVLSLLGVTRRRRSAASGTDE
jgi:hypothetical protein